MKKLSLALSLAFGTTAFAEVPALINYQGRLVDEVGNPIVGKKEFKLDIYDSQTEGTLIYQETLPEITLDEDGAYSFQFGAGESRSETSVVIATGDGEAAFFQKVFEQTPVGVISVTDGTNTFKTGDVPTGEEPFSFTYTASLKRLNLVCNEPPAEGVKFTATFRYAESGIMGALGSATEHWMEVTIGGEKQEPRQRLVAVPFALRAGALARAKNSREMLIRKTNTFEIPHDVREIETAYISMDPNWASGRNVYLLDVSLVRIGPRGESETIFQSEIRGPKFELVGWNPFPINMKLDEGYFHVLNFRHGYVGANSNASDFGKDVFLPSTQTVTRVKYF
ncbi:hypothetical protein N9920_00565 [Akkermansiaceae bacterium]|nr:hypothetical protein [Akkermansiaceae bacterium]